MCVCVCVWIYRHMSYPSSHDSRIVSWSQVFVCVCVMHQTIVVAHFCVWGGGSLFTVIAMYVCLYVYVCACDTHTFVREWECIKSWSQWWMGGWMMTCNLLTLSLPFQGMRKSTFQPWSPSHLMIMRSVTANHTVCYTHGWHDRWHQLVTALYPPRCPEGGGTEEKEQASELLMDAPNRSLHQWHREQLNSYLLVYICLYVAVSKAKFAKNLHFVLSRPD